MRSSGCTLLMLLVVPLLAASCGEENQAPPANASAPTVRDGSMKSASAGNKSSGAAAGAAAATAAAPRTPINASTAAPTAPKGAAIEPPPVPPKDSQYTIFCRDITGPAHVELAKREKEELIRKSGMRGFYVIHQEDRSSILYGYYKTVNDQNVPRDRKALEALADNVGNKLFRSCMVVPIDAPDPTAPAEWDLARLRRGEDDKQHYWTLQIGAYRDSPERKRYAVEAVRDARSQGVEAYYYHGPSISSVCVGCWPAEAIEQQAKGNPRQGPFAGPNKDLVVAPADFKAPQQILNAAAHKNVDVLQAELVIKDPTLQSAKTRFPQHYVNGVPEGVRDRPGGTLRPKESFICPIPIAEASPLMGAGPMANDNGVSPTRTPASDGSNPSLNAIQPVSPSQPPPAAKGSGKLKSLGSK